MGVRVVGSVGLSEPFLTEEIIRLSHIYEHTEEEVIR
jgi:hypothetical protein